MKQTGHIYTEQLPISHLQQLKLREHAEAEREAHPTSSLGVQDNGWASRKLDVDHEQWPLNYFASQVRSLLYEITNTDAELDYWYVLMNNGGEIHKHDHAQSDWAACLYPESVGEDDGGLIEFDTGLIVRPHAGLVVLFPGDLSHRVTPYTGIRSRLSIPFNRIGNALA